MRLLRPRVLVLSGLLLGIILGCSKKPTEQKPPAEKASATPPTLDHASKQLEANGAEPALEQDPTPAVTAFVEEWTRA